MLRKTKEAGQSPENLMRIIMNNVTHDYGYVLGHFDNDNNLDGFLVATHVLPANFIEFVALWTRPGVLRNFAQEGNEYFEKWCRARGARYIIAGLQRAPHKFFNWFHKPLGYKEVGIIIKKEL